MKKIFGAFLALSLILCSSTAFAAGHNRPAVITLYSNPTTGYCWSYSVDNKDMVVETSHNHSGLIGSDNTPTEPAEPFLPDTPIADPEDRPNTPNYDNPDVIDEVEATMQVASLRDLQGAGRYDSWTFKGLKEGNVTITFEYSRPWEKDSGSKIQKVFTYRIDSDLNMELISKR